MTIKANADPNTPPIAIPTAVRRLYRFACTNFVLATGIRNAQAPIMMGKRGQGIHPEQVDEDHARRVVPDAEGHDRAQEETAEESQREQPAL